MVCCDFFAQHQHVDGDKSFSNLQYSPADGNAGGGGVQASHLGSVPTNQRVTELVGGSTRRAGVEQGNVPVSVRVSFSCRSGH